MTDAHPALSGDLGDMEIRDGRVVLTFRRRLSHRPEKVWRGLTAPEHVAAWFPTTIDGQSVAGAPLTFRFRDMQLPPMDGEMLSFEPPSLLELLWGDELLRFELVPYGEGTVLTFTCTFDEIGRAARDGAGWHTCLDQLDCAIADTPAPLSEPDRWRQLHDVYKTRFGPAASTLGPPPEWEEAHRPLATPDA
jgi:uncharacterized protein YndB with AHSA1/START domain